MLRVIFPGNGPVFGLWVEGQYVTDAAPVARFTIGWEAIEAVRYYVSRGCRVEAIARGEVVRVWEP